MAEFVTRRDTVSRTQTLRPGSGKMRVSFVPVPGRVTATVFFTGVDTVVKGKPGADPDKPDFDDILVTTPGDVVLEVLAPGGRRPVEQLELKGSTLTRPIPPLRFSVPDSGPAGTWTLQVTNEGRNEITARARVAFPARRHLIESTGISLELLNHAGQVLIDALRPRLTLGRRATIDFSPEANRLTGGLLRRFSFDIEPDKVLKIFPVALAHIAQVGPVVLSAETVAGGRPELVAQIGFETEGHELVVRTFPFPDVRVDLANLAVTIRIDLANIDRPMLRVDTDVRGEGTAGELAEALVDIAARVKKEAEAILQKPDISRGIGSFVKAGLLQMAEQDHTFAGLRAEADRWVVRHFDDSRSSGPGRRPADSTSATTIRATTGRTTGLTDIGGLQNIDHVVVLMLENRSFDHMLGYLSLLDVQPDVDGLKGNPSNPALDGGSDVVGRRLDDTRIPKSPAHDTEGVAAQISGGTMRGFAASYTNEHPHADPALVMSYYGPEALPVHDFLAREYMVCDRWFCSHPGPTWPNRFCYLTGDTPILDNFELANDQLGYVRDDTIFDHLDRADVDWLVFESDISFLRMFDRHRLDVDHIRPLDHPTDGLFTRAAEGRLPAVTFIDPNYADIPPSSSATDDHPPADLRNGQALVGAIYNALVASPQWESTLLVITYDEHGGFYDHVPPPGTPAAPAAIPRVHPEGPDFLGPRVPTFVISPWVPRGQVSHLGFDHTSTLKTIQARFLSADVDLGPRTAAAHHLGPLLTVDRPRAERPRVPEVPDALVAPHRPAAETALDSTSRDFHESLRRIYLPRGALS